MLSNLPTEITTDILLRLPVKTLIVCTCLSKSFFSLITSHEFINTHIAHNPNAYFFLRYYTDAKKEEKYHLEPDNDNFTGFPSEGFSMPFDSGGGKFCFNVAGCVNGVLCLVNDSSFEGTLIILWNPSIRKSVHVPKPHYVFESYGGYESACGFGFDSVTNDYKVVRVVDLDQQPYSKEMKVEIYRMWPGCWRNVAGCWRNVGIGPKYRIQRRYRWYLPCFFNSFVHWVGCYYWGSKCDTVILKFDMSKESFEIMEMPSMLKDSLSSYNPASDLYVLECRGMLTLIRWNSANYVYTHSVYADYLTTYSVWVMKEYGLVSSWTKVIELKYGDYLPSMPRAIGFRNNGEVIAVKSGGYSEMNKNVIVSFKPEAQGEKLLGELSANEIEPFSFYWSTYVESMALFREGVGIDDQTK